MAVNLGLRIGLAGLASAVALAVPTLAAAHDYIVVASTDPAIARGAAYDSGQHIALAPGQKLTLMHASGNILVLRGAPGGVVAPQPRANDAEADRLAMLRILVAPAPGASHAPHVRGGVCPLPEMLTTLDAIVQARGGGCSDQAATALEMWIHDHTPPDA